MNNKQTLLNNILVVKHKYDYDIDNVLAIISVVCGVHMNKQTIFTNNIIIDIGLETIRNMTEKECQECIIKCVLAGINIDK